MRAGTHCRRRRREHLGDFTYQPRARAHGCHLSVRRGPVDSGSGMRTTLNIQVMVAVAAVLLGYLYGGGPAAMAALFGAGVALSNSMLLVWRLHRSKRQVHVDAHRHLRSFYFSTLERFVVVGSLLAMGLGALQLMPLPLIAAFVTGQMAWMISGLISGNT